jgi:hypothetical protein
MCVRPSSPTQTSRSCSLYRRWWPTSNGVQHCSLHRTTVTCGAPASTWARCQPSGYLHVYAREGLHRASEDWSTGLVYTDYAGHSYRVIRCNSAHLEDHVNRIERTVIVRHTHVHTLTERYQRHRRASGDGFAEPTSAFSNLPEAIDHLAMLSNLQPAGRLFL